MPFEDYYEQTFADDLSRVVAALPTLPAPGRAYIARNRLTPIANPLASSVVAPRAN